MKDFLRDTLVTFIIAAIVFLGLRTTIQSIVIVSASMEPTLPVGQRLIINRVIYKFSEPKRGDIIVFPSPKNPQDEFIKRVIGLPGELIEIRQGTVYIHKTNGTTLALDEPYITDPAHGSFYGEKIPPNEYFGLGDNRNDSGDSRQGWTVAKQTIIGKAWLSIWPPAKWGLAANYPLPE
ncbi:MAG: signal peptidase I [Chloroflexi bacterium]|nr:signal peptidase I [Chloroflexota bacterium]